MKKLPTIEKLAFALETEAPERRISFYEDPDPENLYALVVGTNDDSLRKKLAGLFGCEKEDESTFSESSHFQVYSHWNGLGHVNMRDLADEFIFFEGEFFDFSVTVAELKSLALLSRKNTEARLNIPKFESDWDIIHPGRRGAEAAPIDPGREHNLLNAIAAHFAATLPSAQIENHLQAVAPAGNWETGNGVRETED